MDTSVAWRRIPGRNLVAAITAGALALPGCVAIAEPRLSATVEMPQALQGVWRMGEEPCDTPHPDGDGVLTIGANGWQGYEHRASLRSIAPEPGASGRWEVAAEEVYLSSQFDLVAYTFELSGSRLIIRTDGTAEVYSRCGLGR